MESLDSFLELEMWKISLWLWLKYLAIKQNLSKIGDALHDLVQKGYSYDVDACALLMLTSKFKHKN
jgi:hypothetical protein